MERIRMPGLLKRNSVFLVALTALFCWSFMFAKHNSSLRGIIPFGDDPYDAVGSFAFIIAPLLALLSLVRAVRPNKTNPTSHSQHLYLIRSQQAVVLAVLSTLGSDSVAMARHPGLWKAAPGARELLGLLFGVTIAALAVQWMIRRSQFQLGLAQSFSWRRAGATVLVVGIVLALYPEQLVQSTMPHLITVVVAALMLFALMRVLLTSLVPVESERELLESSQDAGRTPRPWRGWVLATFVGVLVGACAFAGEFSEARTSLPPLRLMFVASVFVGLGLAAILLAYLFLGGPLGLTPDR